MKKIILIVAIAAIAAFGFTYGVDAQQNSPDNFKFKRDNFLKQLNLSDEQKQQISDLRYERQTEAIDLRSQIQKNRLEIKKMIADNNIDDAKIKSLTHENSELQTKIKDSAIDTWLKINKLLTPEQQKIWTKAFANMAEFGRARWFSNHSGMGMKGMRDRGMGHSQMQRGSRMDQDMGSGRQGMGMDQ